MPINIDILKLNSMKGAIKMKKLIAGIGAVVIALMMSFSALALPSPTVSGLVKGVSTATDQNGNAVKIIVKTIPEAEPDFTEVEKKAIEEIKEKKKLREILGSLWEDGLQLADIRNVEIEGDASLVVFPVTITFDVPGITKESNVAVLHFEESVGEWEVVESEAGDSSIEAVFHSLSPVTFVVDADTAEAMEFSVTSPKTGKSNLPSYTGIILAALLGGAVLFIYRKGNTLSE